MNNLEYSGHGAALVGSVPVKSVSFVAPFIVSMICFQIQCH